jgi:LAS superfamily LD-carboxypeptidase LdcB
MSWKTFRDNLVSFGNNPDNISDIDKVAKKWADEYDAAIKRGGDSINKIKIQNGNKAIMEQLFKAALQKGLSSTAPYDLVGEMGKGVIAYWSGAIMQNVPIPIQLPPGATANVSVTSNVVLNPGQWTPPVPGTKLPDFDDEPTEFDIANDVDMPSTENLASDSPVTEEEITLLADELYPDLGEEFDATTIPTLPTSELELIQNPEVIDYDAGLPLPGTSVTESPTFVAQEPEGNNQNGGGPVIYTNVGKTAAGVPPGYEKFGVVRKTTRNGAKKSDGINGSIPYENLRKVNRSYGSGFLHPEAAVALELFLDVCTENGVKFEITPGGGWYRDYENQVRLWNELEKGQAAVPGHSNHGWGIAIDIRTLYAQVAAAKSKIKGAKMTSAEPNALVRRGALYGFFAANAPRFGWYNPASLCDNSKTDEAWHWEYHGFKTLTKEQRNQMIGTFNSRLKKSK